MIDMNGMEKMKGFMPPIAIGMPIGLYIIGFMPPMGMGIMPKPQLMQAAMVAAICCIGGRVRLLKACPAKGCLVLDKDDDFFWEEEEEEDDNFFPEEWPRDLLLLRLSV